MTFVGRIAERAVSSVYPVWDVMRGCTERTRINFMCQRIDGKQDDCPDAESACCGKLGFAFV